MSEHCIIRHSGKSSRNRFVAVLATVAVCFATVTCQLVIGDLPLQGELADSGPPDEPDRADAIAETGSSDVAPESEGDSADAGAEDADSGDADAPGPRGGRRGTVYGRRDLVCGRRWRRLWAHRRNESDLPQTPRARRPPGFRRRRVKRGGRMASLPMPT